MHEVCFLFYLVPPSSDRRFVSCSPPSDCTNQRAHLGFALIICARFHLGVTGYSRATVIGLWVVRLQNDQATVFITQRNSSDVG